jgi:hypothetical protein
MLDVLDRLVKPRTIGVTLTVNDEKVSFGSIDSAAINLGLSGRAHGGPVEAGVPYIVGEHRPELFVPDVPGTIVPSVPRAIAPAGGVATLDRSAPVVIGEVVLPNVRDADEFIDTLSRWRRRNGTFPWE